MEQVKVKITHTCERRITDAKGKSESKVLREGLTVSVDAGSAAILVRLGYAVAV